MEEKKIRVGVDDQQVNQFQDKMRQSAENLARGMIRDARSYTTSSKEVVDSIEEQIRAIEKRNRLDQEFRQHRLEEARSSGEITEAQYKKGVGEMRGESKEDKLQVQLLRELIDTVKSASKEEIREDRQGVEKRLQSSRTANVLDPKGDEFSLLKETLQQGELSRIKSDESFEGGGFERMMMAPGNLMSSNNALDVFQQAANRGGGALRNVGGAGGVMGAALLFGLAKGIGAVGQSAMNLEDALGGYTQLRGGSVRGHMKGSSDFNVAGLSRMGMTISDYYRGRTDLEMGARAQLGEDPLNLMAISRGTTLSQGDVAGMAGLGRHGDIGVSTTTAFFEKFLQQTGQSMAALPEVVQQFTQEARQMVMSTGRVDANDLATVMAKVGQQTELEGDLLGGAMGSLRQGMQRSSNPVIQALQFRAARNTAGEGASVWDMEKIMSDPMGNVDYMQQMLTGLREITGGGQSYERALYNTGIASSPMLAGKMAQLDFDKELKGQLANILKKEKVSFYGAAYNAEGEVSQSTAKMEGMREKYGSKAASEIAAKFNDVADNLEKYLEGTKELMQKAMESYEKYMDQQQAQYESAERLIKDENSKWWEKWLGYVGKAQSSQTR